MIIPYCQLYTHVSCPADCLCNSRIADLARCLEEGTGTMQDYITFVVEYDDGGSLFGWAAEDGIYLVDPAARDDGYSGDIMDAQEAAAVIAELPHPVITDIRSWGDPDPAVNTMVHLTDALAERTGYFAEKAR
ncbi:MAG: hypothetical protein KatS3mg082_3368 [Nitrospiraceae bacterium]|nr:MAG: hypothetical protein KatS3mg051_1833 [Anaerolineae bacterium]GIW56964.1 MAG: hypothetical protein KatS3mg082_3368 [Nitrospiraceae bacterium]